MPLTLKPRQMSAKDPVTGEYKDFDLLASNVVSVNGKTGAVQLDAGDLNVDDSAQTPKTVSEALDDVSRALTNLDQKHDDKIRQISQPTRNMFDMHVFDGVEGITLDENGYYVGKVKSFVDAFGSLVPVEPDFDPDKKYVFSGTYYFSDSGDYTGAALQFRLVLTDETETGVVNLSCDHTTPSAFHGSRSSGGINYLRFYRPDYRGQNCVLHIKEIQIEQGDTYTEYIGHYTAKDLVAMEKIAENRVSIEANTEDISENLETIIENAQKEQADVTELNARCEAIENDLYVLIGTDDSASFTKTVPADATKAVVSGFEEKTIVLNQLLGNVNKTAYGLSYETDENGWIHVSGTSTEDRSSRLYDFGVEYGHKFACIVETDGITLQLSVSAGFQLITCTYGGSNMSVKTNSFIATGEPDPGTTTDRRSTIYTRCGSGNAISGKIRVQVFDLTKMFGSGNEPETVSDFLEIVTGEYYELDSEGTNVVIEPDGILLNDVEQSGIAFAVEENDVITIQTTCERPDIICPIPTVIRYFKPKIQEVVIPEYVAESARVTTELLNENADLRIMLFADSHKFDEFKQKKYADMMGHGIVDYLIGLGDYNDYDYSRTKIEYKNLLLKTLTDAGREANCLYVAGNHDVAIKGPNGGPNTMEYVMSHSEIFDVFCRHYCKNPNIVYDEDNPMGGYYYLDNEAAQIRMIFLNTSDIFKDDGSYVRYTGGQIFMSPRQMTWFAEKACMLNKQDPSNWAIVVFCHFAYPLGASDLTLFKILAAVKTGTSYSETKTVYRRLTLVNDTWTTTVDNVNGDEFSIDVDYTNQGAVDVCGVLFGHEHADVSTTKEGINAIEVRCDNSDLDRFYFGPVNGLDVGTYYFTDTNGKMWTFTTSNSYPTCAYIGYNEYFTNAEMDPMPIGRFDENLQRIGSLGGVTRTDTIPSGGIEITGFVAERDGTQIGNESCEIMCIDKTNKTLTFVPYGTAQPRIISY